MGILPLGMIRTSNPESKPEMIDPLCKLNNRRKKRTVQKPVRWNTRLGAGHCTPLARFNRALLTLLGVQRYATEAWAVLLELKFLRTRTTQQHVIDVTCLLANEKCGFFLFLALGHG